MVSIPDCPRRPPLPQPQLNSVRVCTCRARGRVQGTSQALPTPVCMYIRSRPCTAPYLSRTVAHHLLYSTCRVQSRKDLGKDFSGEVAQHPCTCLTGPGARSAYQTATPPTAPILPFSHSPFSLLASRSAPSSILPPPPPSSLLPLPLPLPSLHPSSHLLHSSFAIRHSPIHNPHCSCPSQASWLHIL